MTEPTREQFAAAVATAVTSVRHLYEEIHLLVSGLRGALAEDPTPLTLVRGTLGKGGKNPRALSMRQEFGALFAPAEELEDEEEDDVDDEAEGEEDDGDSPTESRSRGRSYVIASDRPLLAVRVGLYESRKEIPFEPRVEYAVMSDWTLGRNPSTPGAGFQMRAYMLKRIPRSLGDAGGVGKGHTIDTGAIASQPGNIRVRSRERRLRCTLPAGVETMDLYSLNSAERLEDLAGRMKTMWISATGGKD